MSPKAAGLAKKSGYSNVRVYLEGEPGWSKSGQPTFAATKYVDSGNIILIDLRPRNRNEAARIPRSVSIPLAQLADRIDDIPGKAPVVLYSDDEEDALTGLKQLRSSGHKKVSLVYDSLDNWLSKAGKFETGPAKTEISWKRKLGKGEVSTADFQKAAAGKSEAVILDVRTADEVTSGTFNSAITIPLDEIASRMGELPKDKQIYIHCSTGARAEMAHKQLQKSGFKTAFLVADIECEDGTCELEE